MENQISSEIKTVTRKMEETNITLIQNKRKYANQVSTMIGDALYLHPDSADVFFSAKLNDDIYEVIPAHKIHLIAASDVFKRMLVGSSKQDVVIDVDVTGAAFKAFLQFFYLNEVELSMDCVVDVMKLGQMYNVPECSAVCDKFLRNQLSKENVFWAYNLSIQFDCEHLKNSCETLIGVYAREIFKSTDFLECDSKILAQIVNLNCLSCSEIQLFEACMSWVKATSKQDILTRDLMQEKFRVLLKQIRFGSMTMNDLATLDPSYLDVFSKDEYNEINRMILDGKFQSKIFSNDRRKRSENVPWGYGSKFMRCNCISPFASTQPYDIRDVEKIAFSVNEPLLLKAFLCTCLMEYRNGKNYPLPELSTKFTIIQKSMTNEAVVLCTDKIKIRSDVLKLVTIIKPIFIRPNFLYEIQFEQNPGTIKYQSTALLKPRVQSQDNVIIQFHRDLEQPNDQHAARSLVWAIDFSRI